MPQATPEPRNRINRWLPDEIRVHILRFCSPETAVELRHSSPHWLRVTNSDGWIAAFSASSSPVASVRLYRAVELLFRVSDEPGRRWRAHLARTPRPPFLRRVPLDELLRSIESNCEIVLPLLLDAFFVNTGVRRELASTRYTDRRDLLLAAISSGNISMVDAVLEHAFGADSFRRMWTVAFQRALTCKLAHVVLHLFTCPHNAVDQLRRLDVRNLVQFVLELNTRNLPLVHQVLANSHVQTFISDDEFLVMLPTVEQLYAYTCDEIHQLRQLLLDQAQKRFRCTPSFYGEMLLWAFGRRDDVLVAFLSHVEVTHLSLRSAFQLAFRKEHTRMIRALCDRGTDVAIVGWKAVMRETSDDCITTLLGHRHAQQPPVLAEAVKHATQYQLADMVIVMCAHPDLPCPFDQDNNKLIKVMCSQAYHLAAVNGLLSLPTDRINPAIEGSKPLHIAIDNNCGSIALALMRDPRVDNTVNAHAILPLLCSVETVEAESLQQALEHFPAPHCDAAVAKLHLEQAFFASCAHGTLSSLHHLFAPLLPLDTLINPLEHWLNTRHGVSSQNVFLERMTRGKVALIIAASNGHVAVVEHLLALHQAHLRTLDKNADVEAAPATHAGTPSSPNSAHDSSPILSNAALLAACGHFRPGRVNAEVLAVLLQSGHFVPSMLTMYDDLPLKLVCLGHDKALANSRSFNLTRRAEEDSLPALRVLMAHHPSVSEPPHCHVVFELLLRLRPLHMQADSARLFAELLQTPTVFVTPEHFTLLLSSNNIVMLEVLLFNSNADRLNRLLASDLQQGRALTLACAHNRSMLIQLILRQPNVNPSANDNSALKKACRVRSLTAVNALLSSNKIDLSSDTNAIVESATSSSPEISSIILSDSRLFAATAAETFRLHLESGRVTEAQHLIFTQPDGLDHRALEQAAFHGHTAIVASLIESSGSNLLDHSASALSNAVLGGHIGTVRFLWPLVTQPIDSDFRISLLNIAFDGNHSEIANFLLEQ